MRGELQGRRETLCVVSGIYAIRCERTKLKSARERRSTLSCTAAAASP